MSADSDSIPHLRGHTVATMTKSSHLRMLTQVDGQQMRVDGQRMRVDGSNDNEVAPKSVFGRCRIALRSCDLSAPHDFGRNDVHYIPHS